MAGRCGRRRIRSFLARDAKPQREARRGTPGAAGGQWIAKQRVINVWDLASGRMRVFDAVPGLAGYPRRVGGETENRAADIRLLQQQLEAAENDARAIVDGLTPERGEWRAAAGWWSVAQCLDHLATANRVYLGAMRAPAAHARERGRLRRGPARPGLVGRWFAWTLEPPVRQYFRMRAPRLIKPRSAPGLLEAAAAFTTSHADVVAFLRESADLDLAGVLFPNPFVRGVRFSLATGLHVIAAHERRHLWQAWRVRRQAEQALPAPTPRRE